MKHTLIMVLVSIFISSCQVETPPIETSSQTSSGPLTAPSALVANPVAPSADIVSRVEFANRADYDCSAAASLVNTGRSAVSALQTCIDNAAPDTKILLPGGKYLIDTYLNIRKTVSLGTKGISPSDAACAENDSSRCATFMLSAPPSTNYQTGMIQINAPKVEIDHLVVDGDRANSVRQIISLCRTGATRGQGYNFIVNGTDFKIINSVIRNAPCGTGMEVRGSASRLLFVNNFVGSNGNHNEDMMWSDGLTVHDNEGAIVESNTFFNNTDVDLIFGGCQRCSISKNKIIHDSSFAGSTFAGLMLHSWDPQHGNYTGSVTQNNTVECSYMKRCGFGILLGSRPWYDQPYFGGTVADNTVNNAMAGFVVDGATGAVTIHNNTVTNSGGKFLASCGEREFDAYSISSASLSFVTTNQPAPSNKSYTGCIANWWTKDSTPPRCDGAQYAYPHYGIKDGKCLPSCGVLGGTLAPKTSCAANGLRDVGTAYDVPNCCAGACDPKTQPAPHYGAKNGACLPSCGTLGGTKAPSSSCAANGLRDIGTAYDVPYCCASPCDTKTQPAPHYGAKNGACLPSCGMLGGTKAPYSSCAANGMRDVGTAYDVPYCCAPLCDPKTQPSPHFGVKNGQCRPSCGALGGTKAPAKSCASVGLTDVGVAYDVPYCCK